MVVRGHFDCFVASELFVYICYLLETWLLLGIVVCLLKLVELV